MDKIDIREIFVHPVKGLSARRCDHAELVENFGLRGDRAFALMFADTGTPEPLTPWLSKQHFAVQNDWGKLAALDCSYDGAGQTLEIRHNGESLLVADVGTSRGRDRVGDFFTAYLQTLSPSPAARHPRATPVRLVGTPTGETRYQDRDRGQISIISRATLDDIARKVGIDAIDPRRFRPNLIVDGIGPWAEFDWVGCRLRAGPALVQVTAPIGRCLNIDVNPDTGDRDVPLLSELSKQFGHAQTGVIATVIEGGAIAKGDAIEILD
jgi:uncharacterized protein YcbX